MGTKAVLDSDITCCWWIADAHTGINLLKLQVATFDSVLYISHQKLC